MKKSLLGLERRQSISITRFFEGIYIIIIIIKARLNHENNIRLNYYSICYLQPKLIEFY